MSTQNDIQILDAAALQHLSGSSKVVGAKQIRKALNAGSVSRVYLAQNADPALTEDVPQFGKEELFFLLRSVPQYRFFQIRGHAEKYFEKAVFRKKFHVPEYTIYQVQIL